MTLRKNSTSLYQLMKRTTKHGKDKMADVNHLSDELLSLLSPYNFTKTIFHLANGDALPQCHFPCSELSKHYWLDTWRCYTRGRKNAQYVFEIFGSYSDERASDVRHDMIHGIKGECELYAQVGYAHLKMLGLTIDQWLTLMSSDGVSQIS